MAFFIGFSQLKRTFKHFNLPNINEKKSDDDDESNFNMKEKIYENTIENTNQLFLNNFTLQKLLGKNLKINPKIEELYKKIYFMETINAFLTAIVVVVSLTEYELAYFPHFYSINEYEYKSIENKTPYWGMPIRIIQAIICIVTAIISIFSTKLEYQVKTYQKIYVEQSFIKTPLFYHLIFDIIICLIHPIPYLDKIIDIKSMGRYFGIRLQTFFYCLTFLKCYLIMRTIALHTKYKGVESQLYCQETGMEATASFALKATQKDEPFKILSITLIAVTCIFGMLLRMFEMVGASKGDNYKFFTNGIWNIIVAMTTVGYGDYYPETHFGRAIVIFAVFIGTVIMSLMVVALNTMTSFDSEEERAFSILQRLDNRQKYNDSCQKLIEINFKLFQLKKSFDKKGLASSNEYANLLSRLARITREKLEIKRVLEKDSFCSDMDKLNELESTISINLRDIIKNLNIVDEVKLKLRKKKMNQILLIDNINNTLKLTRDHIKPMIYKLFYKNNPKFCLDLKAKSEDIVDLIDVQFSHDKKELKRLTIEKIERFLFGCKEKNPERYILRINDENKDAYYDSPNVFMHKKQKLQLIKQRQSCLHLGIKNNNQENFSMIADIIDGKSAVTAKKKNVKELRGLLLKKVNDYSQFLKEKYSNSPDNSKKNYISQSSLEFFERDPFDLEYENLKKKPKMPTASQNLSQKTIFLFESLSKLKNKNNKIYNDKTKRLKILEPDYEFFKKEDILESLTNDINFKEDNDLNDLSDFELSPIKKKYSYDNFKKTQEEEKFEENKSKLSHSITNDEISRYTNDGQEKKLLIFERKNQNSNRKKENEEKENVLGNLIRCKPISEDEDKLRNDYYREYSKVPQNLKEDIGKMHDIIKMNGNDEFNVKILQKEKQEKKINNNFFEEGFNESDKLGLNSYLIENKEDKKFKSNIFNESNINHTEFINKTNFTQNKISQDERFLTKNKTLLENKFQDLSVIHNREQEYNDDNNNQLQENNIQEKNNERNENNEKELIQNTTINYNNKSQMIASKNLDTKNNKFFENLMKAKNMKNISSFVNKKKNKNII